MKGFRIDSGLSFTRDVLPPLVMFALVVGALSLLSRVDARPRPDSTQPMAENGVVGCTAFSVNDRNHLFVTAAHCVHDENGEVAEGLTLGGGVFVVVRTDNVNDLSLLLSIYSAPAYALGPRPSVGDVVSARGFAFHSSNALSFWGRVSNLSYAFPQETNTCMVLDMEVLRGISGSPVLLDGKVVSVTQGVVVPPPVGRVVWGARWEALRDFVGQDWER